LLPAIFLFCAVLTVFSNGRYLGTGDTLPAVLLPVAVLKGQGFFLDEFFKPGSFFYDEDVYCVKSKVDAGLLPWWVTSSKGRIISSYPIIPGLLNIPVNLYAHLSGIDIERNCFFLSKLSAVLIAAISVIFFFLFCHARWGTVRVAIVAASVYAFCTCVWGVAAAALWQHGPSLLFLTGALILAERKDRSAWMLGFMLGCAFVNRPANIFLVAATGLYAFCRRKDRFSFEFCLCFALPIIMIMWYSWVAWGNIMCLGQRFNSDGRVLSDFGGNFVEGLAGLLISPSRGLFVFSPFFILSFAYIPTVFRRPFFAEKCLAVGVLCHVVLHAFWSQWWGCTCFGYRLLTELIPFLMVFFIDGWKMYGSRIMWVRWFVVVSLCFAAYMQFLGTNVYPTDFNSRPVDIDSDPARLWDIRYSEPVLMHNDFVKCIDATLTKRGRYKV
jgi:hypothetical protein